MKLLPKLLAATSIFAATAAIAGPPVTVTFKNNNTTTDATYAIVTSNESSTYANASPKPATTVSKLGSNSYAVTSLISPDVNFAKVRYRIGSRECVFGTSLVNALQHDGRKVPQWHKTAKGSGGASCTARITSADLGTHGWTVEFIMK